jgi:hypothetical protein
MNTPRNEVAVSRFEVTAKVRWFSFIVVFVFLLAFFLAMPSSQISAADERVNWDNRCVTELCQ